MKKEPLTKDPFKETHPWAKHGKKDTTDIINKSPAGLTRKFCGMPFDHIEISSQGDVYLCCPSWLPHVVGNLKTASLNEIFNGEITKNIRQSILDGTFEYCDTKLCPHIQSGRLPNRDNVDDERHRIFIDDNSVEVPDGPIHVAANYDQSCNLSCPSCRTEKIYINEGPVFEERLGIQNRLFEELFSESKEKPVYLIITGSGDAFGSRVFRELLTGLDGRQYPNLKIELKTNGVMFTPRYWERMEKLHGNIKHVLASVDAATKETYDVVRRGGNWDALQENIRFLCQLRKQNLIKFLRLDFVVQQSNYREIPDFVRMAFNFGSIDRVTFSLVVDWGTWSKEEFDHHAIWKKTHAEFADFMAVLQAPVLDNKIVDLGNLMQYAEFARSGSQKVIL